MAPPRLGEEAFPPESTYSAEGKTNPSRNLGQNGRKEWGEEEKPNL
jgi:hypothetical protein